MKCGLLGAKLGHSYSPWIHQALASYSYSLFERQPNELESFLRFGDFSGLNVTMPYKKDVIPYLNELSPVAQRLGSVNTIVRRKDGTLIGHNTDFFGFQTMLDRSGLDVSGKKVLVLGSGGASNTVVAVLQDRNADVIIISRTGENNYDNLHLHVDARVIVNTTPVGMYPNTLISPISLDSFPHLEGVLDIIFNPARTQLLLDAEEKGLVAMNGLLMLVAQAKESSQWFTGTEIPDSRIDEVYSQLQRRMENIILIGMPGCGKSTIGQHLAEKTGREFVDADKEIEAQAGMSIPQIFETLGEPGFREWESTVLGQLGKRSGLVIATGGGCVTQQRNYPPLHQNGRIFWIRRQLAHLPTEGRPLSQTNSLSQMYLTRKPLYEQFSDHTISNDGALTESISQIMTLLEGSH